MTNDWTKSSDSMPEKNRLVLGYYLGFLAHSGVTWKREGLALAVRWENGWNDRLMRDARERMDADYLKVTHWQYLPDLPEEGDTHE